MSDIQEKVKEFLAQKSNSGKKEFLQELESKLENLAHKREAIENIFGKKNECLTESDIVRIDKFLTSANQLVDPELRRANEKNKGSSDKELDIREKVFLALYKTPKEKFTKMRTELNDKNAKLGKIKVLYGKYFNLQATLKSDCENFLDIVKSLSELRDLSEEIESLINPDAKLLQILAKSLNNMESTVLEAFDERIFPSLIIKSEEHLTISKRQLNSLSGKCLRNDLRNQLFEKLFKKLYKEIFFLKLSYIKIDNQNMMTNYYDFHFEQSEENLYLKFEEQSLNFAMKIVGIEELSRNLAIFLRSIKIKFESLKKVSVYFAENDCQISERFFMETQGELRLSAEKNIKFLVKALHDSIYSEKSTVRESLKEAQQLLNSIQEINQFDLLEYFSNIDLEEFLSQEIVELQNFKNSVLEEMKKIREEGGKRGYGYLYGILTERFEYLESKFDVLERKSSKDLDKVISIIEALLLNFKLTMQLLLIFDKQIEKKNHSYYNVISSFLTQFERILIKLSGLSADFLDITGAFDKYPKIRNNIQEILRSISLIDSHFYEKVLNDDN